MSITTTGVSVIDLYTQKGRTTGKRYLARAWDPRAARYKTKAFDSEPEARRWAHGKQSELRLGLDTARVVRLSELRDHYLGSLRLARRSDRQWTVVATSSMPRSKRDSIG